jgi:thiol-disulfide isomerase/thioredoxin
VRFLAIVHYLPKPDRDAGMTNSPRRLEKPSAATVGVAVLALILLLSAVIVAISPPLAREEARACRAPEGAFVQYEAADPPRPLAPLAIVDDAGRSRNLAEFRGEGVVLNLWATWCAPCVREMPQLDRLKASLAGDGIRVLALSVDRGGVPLIRKFYDVNVIKNLEVLIDSGGNALRDLRIHGLPTTVLVDAEGREVGRALGAAEWDSQAVTAFLRRCLGKAKAGKR